MQPTGLQIPGYNYNLRFPLYGSMRRSSDRNRLDRSRENAMDESIATNKECAGLGVHILGLSYPLLQLAWFACNQIGVLNVVMLNQGPQRERSFNYPFFAHMSALQF